AREGGATTGVGAALEELRRGGLLRELRTLDSAPGARVRLDGRDVLLLCSNDYLGLAGHPRVRAAAAEAAQRWGAGAGASRLVSGNLALHERLEAELAAFKGTEACLLFGSGYLANTGVIAALAGRDDVILSDARNHASIVDGCRLSRAQTVVYDHGDLDALATALRRADGRRCLIVTDAVFSMDGDLAPLEGIVELARRHRARVLVDEAHATGVVGPGGRGLVAELGLEQEGDVVVGTLGKALGSYGAFAACTRQMAAFLLNRARTAIFSTALPPPAAGAALEALRLVGEQPTLLARLHANARTLCEALADQDLPIPPGGDPTMPIVPLVIGDPHAAMGVCEAALAGGVFAQAIRPPTVAAGTSRLRLVATAAHEAADLRAAAATLGAACRGSAHRCEG
ncbi:MAG TPA: 8-amino-7-oxononanoate synthase, partial [Solirubrobacteraceae bacterium]|nr:8-amino-7-oxononanoate synthase [Solirubrobacteraceae bacterium]